jgi:PAS domain S-box-containing protein
MTKGPWRDGVFHAHRATAHIRGALVSTEPDTRVRKLPNSDWLVGGRQMGEVVRSIDWSQSPLGPINTWSASLRSVVSLTLNSSFPINLAWGPEHTQIYNDGYRPFCGAKHPVSMGQDYRECWASAFPVIGEAFYSALEGNTEFLEDQRMFLDRHGYLEETFFTFGFSPILGERGTVAGLFHPVTETTSKMVAQRRTRTLRDLAARAINARSMNDGLQMAAEVIAEAEFDVPFVLFYGIDPAGGSAELLAWSGLPAGGPASPRTLDLDDGTGWPIARVFSTRASLLVDDVAQLYPGLSCGPYPDPVAQAYILPITPPGHSRPVCAMVAGLSTRLPRDEAYRSFFELLAAAVTTVIVNAIAIQVERQRAEAFAAIDRAKTTFFNNVSHEFRTPLTLLLGPIEDELSELTTQSPPARRERLEAAHRNSLRLLRLVNTLLDFARIEDGRTQARYELTDLGTLTAELAGNFRSACERAGLHLIVDCPVTSEPVYVDHDLWEAIVLNLLSNAFKFTSKGEIAVSVACRDGLAQLAVRDTGIGVPPDEQPRIFERFHRVPGASSRTHEGTGIGLAFVQQLAQLHGGSVQVESELGRGSTFTVSIPLGASHLPAEQVGDASAERLPDVSRRSSESLVQEAMRWLPEIEALLTPSSEQPGADQPPPGSRQRIILADDNADMRQYVARLLSDHYDVEAVVDGQAALDAVRRSPPALVLSDVMMPHLDGFGLIRELRADAATSEVPVILLSARAGDESRIEGLQAGADDYLVKPFTSRELFARVTAHLQLSELRQQGAAARSAQEQAVAVAASEEQLRTITDALPVLIAYVDADRRYRFVNRAYEDHFGVPRSRMLGCSLEEAWPDRYQDDSVTYVKRALAGEPVTFESDVRDPDGSVRIFQSTYKPDVGSDGVIRGFFALSSDISERKRSEREIQRLNDDLEQRVVERTAELAAVNKDLESFSYSISHDLRAPLRAIDGFTRLLQDQHFEVLPEEARRYCRLVRENAQTMGQLVDDLLAFSRLGRSPLSKRPVDLSALVRHCLDDLEGELAGRDVELTVGELGTDEADPALLKQVWLNLLSNAVKYTRQRDCAEIQVGVEQRDDERVYFCRDNGAGFDMAYADKLFGVFQRLHSSKDYEGTGVGLAIVEQIIRRHGGRVWAEAEVDRGATFRFTLEEKPS